MKNNSLWQRLSAAKPSLLQNEFLMAEIRANPMVLRTYPDPVDAIEAYLRFLYLAATEPRGAVPPKAVDAIWHAHLVQTRAYKAFCETVIKRFIHHNPSLPAFGQPPDSVQAQFRDTLQAERREFEADSLAEAMAHDSNLFFKVALPCLVVISYVTYHTIPDIGLRVILTIIATILSARILTAFLEATRQHKKPARSQGRGESGSGTSSDAGDPGLFFLCGHGSGGSGGAASQTVGIGEALHGSGSGDVDADGGGSSCSSCGGD